MTEADGVARGVILLQKEKQLQWPIQCVSPLEIRKVEDGPKQGTTQRELTSQAAVNAAFHIRSSLGMMIDT